MKKIELKPCPYCGAEAEIEVQDPHFDFDEETYRVVCEFHQTWCPLHLVMLNDYDTSQEAAKAWNRRCRNV